jgi:hypothetical protein
MSTSIDRGHIRSDPSQSPRSDQDGQNVTLTAILDWGGNLGYIFENKIDHITR